MTKQSIMARLAALKTTGTPELKAMWKELYGCDAPNFSRQYLEPRLAYRIQELSLGGLSKATKERLRNLADNKDDKRATKPTCLSTGTMLRREWRGGIYKVTVLTDGYEYEGKRFKSLSRIAREITGTNWNGHAFFGLRRKAA